MRRNPELANRLKELIAPLDGVERADVNSLTGSVLIHYRGGVSDGERVIARIMETGWAGSEPAPFGVIHASGPAPRSRKVRRRERALAKFVLQSVAQVAIERSVFALAAAIL